MSESIIFIYHRVIELRYDPQGLAIPPGQFEEHIEYLKDNFTNLRLQELIQRITSGKSIENCTVITFDDGYADNLHFAKPILEKYHVPATFFVTVGMIDSQREFWWDELERIFLTEKKFFKPLKIKINKQEYEWNIHDNKTAETVYREIHPLLKYLPHKERERNLDDLFDWAELDRNAGRETHRVLNKEELQELAQGEGIEIGSHAFTHTVLKTEPEQIQWIEINHSRAALEQFIDGSVLSFSYPFGLRRDIGKDTVQLVKKAGYVCGISNIQGNVDNKTEPYLIPRRIVRNWSLAEFQKEVASYLHKQKFFGGSRGAVFQKSPPGRRRQKDIVDKYVDHIEPCSMPGDGKKRSLQNILFINCFDRKGGAGKLSYRMFNYLNKKKHKANMLVGNKTSSDQQVHRIAEVDAEDQRFLKVFQEEEGWLDVFHYSSFQIKHAPSFQEADIVHLHSLQKDYFSILALPEIACLKPLVWTFHDMLAFTGHCSHSYDCDRWQRGCGNCPYLDIGPDVNKDQTDLLWQLKQLVYQYADFSVVCPSNWLKSKVEKSILKDKEITLIYNGVDETVFTDFDKRKARKELGLPTDKIILLFVTAFRGLKNEVKGGPFICRILEELPALSTGNALLLSIGKVRKRDNFPEHFKALPYIEDESTLALYYSAADLLLYPSLADNCPLVVLESLACGTPVVSFHTGGIPELVTHMKTGYLAKYEDFADLVKGIEFFLNNPSLLKNAGRKARESILKTFTLKKMMGKYLDLYKARYRHFFMHQHSINESYKIKVAKILRSRYNYL